jgi:alpha-amylase
MKRHIRLFSILIVLLLVASGCSSKNNVTQGNTATEDVSKTQDNNKGLNEDPDKQGNSTGETEGTNQPDGETGIPTTVDYKYKQELNVMDDNYRTYYEVFLYSFCDSNGDGIGDINGLISKLDYINDGDPSTDTDLGFNGIWLMPIMPSDTYHKYDVKDYYDIDEQYGTIEDFKRLIKESNKRGIKVIIDLVLNHSSSSNPWFLSAVKSLSIKPCGQEVCTHEELCADHNPYVKYYNFVEGNPGKDGYYSTGVDDWYYEGVFTSTMPDLNLANQDLRNEIEKIMSYWLDLGVGGFRLDAALHYYSDDTEKNNEVLSWLNSFIKSKNEQNYMVAEIWTNFSKYAQYYASGIDSVFDFAFATESGVITKTLNLAGVDNSGKSFGNAMIQVQNGLKKYNEAAVDAPFFTNHDTARASGYFSGNVDKIKMAGGMNLLMNGSAFVYYGEEIGMSGSGRDENKRAPMYWSTTDTTGMTDGPKDMETVTHNFGTVEEQIKDPLSIYNYYKRAIRLRNENPEIARGEIAQMPEIMDSEICAITKTYNGSKIEIIYNFAEESKEVTVSKSTYGYEGIRGYLSVSGEEVTLEGETLTMPPYSVVILK